MELGGKQSAETEVGTAQSSGRPGQQERQQRGHMALLSYLSFYPHSFCGTYFPLVDYNIYSTYSTCMLGVCSSHMLPRTAIAKHADGPTGRGTRLGSVKVSKIGRYSMRGAAATGV